MNAIIVAALLRIQREQNFRIVYACESGSRAWGFPSEDSDYDVRFIYVNPPDWYLSVNLENQPDVFELPITDSLDISGWDLRKALKLLYKSNPPLLAVCRKKASPCTPCLRGASFLSNFNTETRRSRRLHREIRNFGESPGARRSSQKQH